MDIRIYAVVLIIHIIVFLVFAVNVVIPTRLVKYSRGRSLVYAVLTPVLLFLFLVLGELGSTAGWFDRWL